MRPVFSIMVRLRRMWFLVGRRPGHIVLDFEHGVEQSNIELNSSCAYVASPNVKNKWKQTAQLKGWAAELRSRDIGLLLRSAFLNQKDFEKQRAKLEEK